MRINAVCPEYTETPMTAKNAQIVKAMDECVGFAVQM